MKYGSVCSGIEAATVAWHPLGWEAQWLAEVEPFPSAVLQHHYPDTPNMGDMTKFKEWPDATIDVLVGGTPCQSFSVAGLRKGLDDPRGNLMLTYLAIAVKYRPKWVVWENVPGVLSSNGGRDFATFFRGLEECGYGVAYRILDAQYFGVAQRRRRVFVVGCLGSWQRAAAVLFERDSLCGNPAPSRKAGQVVTPTIRAGAPNGGKGHGVRSGDSKDELIVHILSRTLTSRYDSSEDGTGRGLELIPVGVGESPDVAHCLRSGASKADKHESTTYIMSTGQAGAEIGIGIGTTLNCNHEAPIAAYAVRTANTTANGHGIAEEVSHTLDQAQGQAVATQMQVRRLTPTECERLQGFPDGYTNIPWRNKPQSPDGPRYKALGNSMAVPVMAWIGKRIQEVDNLTTIPTEYQI